MQGNPASGRFVYISDFAPRKYIKAFIKGR